MGTFAVGSVVLISFPYADFSKYKKRPALVIGISEFNNLILCQITSKAETSKSAMSLKDSDFLSGSLQLNSFVRADKIFTVETSIIEGKIGILKKEKIESVKTMVRQLFI